METNATIIVVHKYAVYVMESRIEFVEDSDSDEVIEISSSGDISSADDFQDSPSFSTLNSKSKNKAESRVQASAVRSAPPVKHQEVKLKINLKPQSGYQVFLDEMKTVLIGDVEDVNESAKQMWDQLDQDAQDFYHEKYQEELKKHEEKKAKTSQPRFTKQLGQSKKLNKKKHLPPPPKLHRAPANIKTPPKRKSLPPASRPSVLSPGSKVKRNSFEREPILQSLMAMENEPSEKKPSKIACVTLKGKKRKSSTAKEELIERKKRKSSTAKEEPEELIEECYLDSSDQSENLSDSVEDEAPRAQFKTCEREKCSNMAVAGQPWGEGFCSEKCVIKNFRKDSKILLEDFNRP